MTEIEWENQLRELVYSNSNLMNDLRTARGLGLPDWYIAAGYIRTTVWDALHGYAPADRHDDIDLIYFDPKNLSEERDKQLEAALHVQTGNSKWSVKNQARMHLRNGDEPYRSSVDAMSMWVETVAGVGVRLDEQDKLHIAAAYGLSDLFLMVHRRSPRYRKHHIFKERMLKKQWSVLWPKVRVVED
ncbi:nucleotidyltransferase family protein [Paenibacillus xylaniclasticus]|uniref:nucleotidyltransferase family protein n=1 Tax=Paenibacillus xylaniclasticus TaxID=588083 RepID=UPI00176B27DE|nr:MULTISPECIES: nucleotidyltransferase family protein [Paenibacillus]GFN33890.1 nitrate reductase [Paenibacillus curdlanolyticus]